MKYTFCQNSISVPKGMTHVFFVSFARWSMCAGRGNADRAKQLIQDAQLTKPCLFIHTMTYIYDHAGTRYKLYATNYICFVPRTLFFSVIVQTTTLHESLTVATIFQHTRSGTPPPQAARDTSTTCYAPLHLRTS